jgi:hypothetical protein
MRDFELVLDRNLVTACYTKTPMQLPAIRSVLDSKRSGNLKEKTLKGQSDWQEIRPKGLGANANYGVNTGGG